MRRQCVPRHLSRSSADWAGSLSNLWLFATGLQRPEPRFRGVDGEERLTQADIVRHPTHLASEIQGDPGAPPSPALRLFASRLREVDRERALSGGAGTVVTDPVAGSLPHRQRREAGGEKEERRCALRGC